MTGCPTALYLYISERNDNFIIEGENWLFKYGTISCKR